MRPPQLFTPGPTMLPEKVREQLAQPMIHHRSPEFEQVVAEVDQKMNRLCGAEKTIFISGSGTATMEAVVNSMFKEGDEVIAVSAGKFGQRWLDLARCYDLNLKAIEVPWGQAVDLEDIKKNLSPETKAVLIQACETSTGVFHPVYEVAELLSGTDTLMIVDAITALGVYDLDLKKHKIDALIGGSQKALMCPPGLSWVSLSQKALGRIRQESRSLYFSLAKELKAQNTSKTAYTPAISLFQALNVALDMIELEGKQYVFERHAFMAKLTRESFRRLGFELFNDDRVAAKGLTAVKPMADQDVKAWIQSLKKEYNLWMAGGQEHLAGKVFRFAHMGYCYPENLLQAFEWLEDSLKHQSEEARNKAATAYIQEENHDQKYRNPHL